MNEQIAEWFDVCELVPWEDNPRNNDQAVDEIANSIKRFGWTNPILARLEDNMVIAGHTRLKAAVALGMNRVPVRFLDVDPVQARLIAIADNKLGERADWNDELLSQVLSDFSDEDLHGLGFDDDELDRLLGEDTDTFDVDEDTPEVEDVVHSVLGEVYQLGQHRLMCGDCTDIEQVEILMNGHQADLYLTDPPYNIDLHYDNEIEDKHSKQRRKDGLSVMNDKMSFEQFNIFLESTFRNADTVMKSGCSYYIFHADNGDAGLSFRLSAHNIGWKIRKTLIWVKSRITFCRHNYHYQHEPCLFGWKCGSGHKWYNDRKQSTTLFYDKPSANIDHPTMKPIELFCYLIANSTKKGDLVFDSFGGSGTSIIASALKNRVCYTMELSPAYCDVIRRRWTQYANDNGLEPGDGAL